MGRDGPTALRGSETTARVLVTAGPYRLSGRVVAAAGDGDGSDDRDGDGAARGWAHEYWDVHASDGAVYRLHRDARDGRFLPRRLLRLTDYP